MRPATYEFRMTGRLPDLERAEFPGMEVRQDGGETILRGRVQDQAELAGVVVRADALGTPVRSFCVVGPAAAGPEFLE